MLKYIFDFDYRDQKTHSFESRWTQYFFPFANNFAPLSFFLYNRLYMHIKINLIVQNKTKHF